MLKAFNGTACSAILLLCLSLSGCGDASQLRSGEHELSLRLSDHDPQQPALRYTLLPGDQLQLRIWSPRKQTVRWSDEVAGTSLAEGTWHTLSRSMEQEAPVELLSEDSGRVLIVLKPESS